jgi:hypothetical protein
MSLAKQIKQLEHEITLEKAQLFVDYAVLKQKLGTKPNLLKGFLWGLSLGFLIIAPKIKHKTRVKPNPSAPHPEESSAKHKEISLQRFLLTSLSGLIKLL